MGTYVSQPLQQVEHLGFFSIHDRYNFNDIVCLKIAFIQFLKGDF